MSSLTYKTGNLIGDVSESVTRINWTVYGKIANITKGGNTMHYGYDATGNRITRKVNANQEDYYEKNLRSNDKVRLFGLSINPNYGYKTWNSVKNRKLPKGHPGDPVLKDNNIREPFTQSNTKNTRDGSSKKTYTY